MVLLIVWAADDPEPGSAELAAARERAQLEQAQRDAEATRRAQIPGSRIQGAKFDKRWYGGQ
jgi:hypothetical protein